MAGSFFQLSDGRWAYIALVGDAQARKTPPRPTSLPEPPARTPKTKAQPSTPDTPTPDTPETTRTRGLPSTPNLLLHVPPGPGLSDGELSHLRSIYELVVEVDVTHLDLPVQSLQVGRFLMGIADVLPTEPGYFRFVPDATWSDLSGYGIEVASSPEEG